MATARHRARKPRDSNVPSQPEGTVYALRMGLSSRFCGEPSPHIDRVSAWCNGRSAGHSLSSCRDRTDVPTGVQSDDPTLVCRESAAADLKKDAGVFDLPVALERPIGVRAEWHVLWP